MVYGIRGAVDTPPDAVWCNAELICGDVMQQTIEPKSALRKIKRSRVLQVSSLMASVSFTLAACGAPPERAAVAHEGEWDTRAETTSYATVAECAESGTATLAECQAAHDEAAALAPKFSDQADCEEQFGAGQCEQKAEANGGSVFMPILAGFLLGRMLSGGQRASASPLFRPGTNARMPGAPLAGNPAAKPTQEKAGDSRAVSRGGFGSSSRSSYGG